MVRFAMSAVIGLVLIQAAFSLVSPTKGTGPLDRGTQINNMEQQLLGK